MTVYVDSSVLLRIALAEPGTLRTWKSITRPLASELIRLECLRAIDRARVRFGLEDARVSEQRAAVIERLRAFDLIRIDSSILDRAAEPFPTQLASLDAIHLATALAARMDFPALALATHDRELATAARAVGFTVHGAP